MRRMGIVVLALLWTMPVWAGEIIYVDDDAALGGDGTSWETAYKFLQDALGAAEVGDEIRLAQGTYCPDCNEACPGGNGDREVSFFLQTSLVLKGGYAGLTGIDPNAWDVDLYETILSGDLDANDVGVVQAADLIEEPTRLENSRHVVVVGDRDVPVTGSIVFEGLVVTGGYALSSSEYWWQRNGGGMLLQGDSNVIIRNCRFLGNVGYEGGGLSLLQAQTIKLEVASTRFEGNAATHLGGGNCCNGVFGNLMVDITDCDFIKNWSGLNGGGLWFFDGSMTIARCQWVENACAAHGGGAYCSSYTEDVEVFESLFEHNVAGFGGGGIAGRNLLISQTHFVGNRCTGTRGGGGAYISGNNTEIVNSLFAGNTADYHGGAITYWDGQLSVVNCTSQGNRAPRGAFVSIVPYAPWPTATTAMAVQEFSEKPDPIYHLQVNNCIIDDGQDAITINIADPERHLWDIQYCNIVDEQIEQRCSDGNEVACAILNGPGNLFVDPCFVADGYWDVNDTLDDEDDDFFVAGDYHLQTQAGHWDPNSETWIQDDVTSLCIDAGDPNSPIMYEPFPNGGRINMGAYGGTTEASKSYFGEPVCDTIIAGDINGDGRVDLTDMAILMRHWTE